jgi:hypothetical protein
MVYFGPDGVGQEHKKVVIKTLLYCTSDSGRYIQNMFVRLHRGETIQNFNIWIYEDNKPVRGGGLFIDKKGVATIHHFLMPHDGTKYNFLPGEYLMEVFIEQTNGRLKLLLQEEFEISTGNQKIMVTDNIGINFDWAPNTQNYSSYIIERPKYELPHVVYPYDL